MLVEWPVGRAGHELPARLIAKFVPENNMFEKQMVGFRSKQWEIETCKIFRRRLL
jgi:hypothetical protein